MITKDTAETNPNFGEVPTQRDIETHIKFSVFNLNKPPGPTSHQATDWVKQVLGVSRAGHSGTLDPKVTGVLPIGLENSTRVMGSLLLSGKEYVGVMHVHKEVAESELLKVINQFTGKIMQLPPVRSAVKREIRERSVYSFDVLEINGKDILFRTSVQAGTYIRKLCSDIGGKIGGAHMAELRRTRAGPFTEDSSHTLQELADAVALYKKGEEKYIRDVLLPVEAAVVNLKKIWIKDGAVDAVCNGSRVSAPGIVRLDEGMAAGDVVVIMSLKDELVALGNALVTSQEIAEAEKGWMVSTDRVVLPAGTYPRMWKTHPKDAQFPSKP